MDPHDLDAQDARLPTRAEIRHFDRRRFLARSVLTVPGLVLSNKHVYGLQARPSTGGKKFAGLVRFEDEKNSPADTPIGKELDRRLYTDLSRISGTQLVTPTAEFFIRSGASQLLPDPNRWKMTIDGLVEQSSALEIRALQNRARPLGLHLIECAGNVRLTRFGLISVANWTGVPLSSVLASVKARPEATRIQVTGFDDYASPTSTSIPGASWIFTMQELQDAGAFLATGMNGQLLTPDHGAPLRLVVPGWYGCSCIKWVNRVTLVDDEVEATSQMREYAARTLQQGVPTLARDFAPATIDHAAMPVRVEKWISSGKVTYRVAGIVWGGSQPVKELRIQFNPEEDSVLVSGFRQMKTAPWAPWTHEWSPKSPGEYSIRLVIADPSVRTRKLDLGMYVRSVEISEV